MAEQMSKANQATSWAVNIANDPAHGYSQLNRWGPDYDCSSFVIQAYEQAGVPVKRAGANRTSDMKAAFLACGFKDVTSQVNLVNGYGTKLGDVLLNEQNHAAMALDNGQVVHARSSEGNNIPGDQSGNEIRVQGYYNYPWDCVLRYMGGDESTATAPAQEPVTPASAKRRVLRKGMVGEDVRELQENLVKLGYDTGGIDGDFGKKTFLAVVAFQEDHGLEVDGVAGPATMSVFESIKEAEDAEDINVHSTAAERKEAVTAMRGADISNYQRGLTIQQLKDAGMDFAIIKVTEGSRLVDGSAFDFYSQAYGVGFPLGGYCFSHAINAQQAMAEGAYLLDAIKRFPMPCGLFLDIEEQEQLALPKEQLLNVIRGWCAAIGGAGYIPGVYGSEGNLWSKISPADLPDGCLVWVAKWSNAQPSMRCDVWQNSDNGRVDGYAGPVDTDVGLSERFRALVDIADYHRSENAPDGAGDTDQGKDELAPDACPIAKPDPVVMALQLLMAYKHKWGKPDGQKSPEFFSAVRAFIADLEKL